MNARTAPAVLLVLLVALLGCPSPDVPPPNDDPAPPPEEPPTEALPGVSVAELIRANAERAPEQLELPVLRRLDEPQEIDRETRANRHQPAEEDTLYVYHYDGLELDFMRTFEGREIIRTIDITHERYDTPQEVRVGMRREEVHDRLGEPDEAEAEVDRYHVVLNEVGPEELIEISYRDDQVVRIHYGFYVD